MRMNESQNDTASCDHLDVIIEEFVGSPSPPEKLRDQMWVMEAAGKLKKHEWETFKLKAQAYRANHLANTITAKELTAFLSSLYKRLRDVRRARVDSLYADQEIAEAQQDGDDNANRVLPLGFTFKKPDEKRMVAVPLLTATESNIIRSILQTSKDAGYQIVSDGTRLLINKRTTQMIDGQNKSVFSLTRGTASNVLSILSNECMFSRESGENINRINPPPETVKTIHEALIEQAPRLTARAAVPFLHNNEIVTERGYHAAGTWLEFVRHDARYDYPETPTDEEVAAAVATLKAIYCEPFKPVDYTDVANILGCAIMMLVTPGSPGRPPGVLIRKPAKNSGGTTLGEFFGMTGSGRIVPVGRWPTDDEEEQSKTLTTGLAPMPSALIFDNVKGILGGATLAAVMTALKWFARRLGHNDQMIEFTIRSLIVFAGNGVEVDDDLSRRLIYIRLNSFVDEAEAKCHRAGSATKQEWIDRFHTKSVEAILTLISNWIAKGMPRGKTMDSYHEITGVVGGILDAGGVKGWLEGQEDRVAEISSDEEFEKREFHRELYGLFKREADRTGQQVEDVRLSPGEMIRKRQEEMDATEHRGGKALWGALPSKLTEPSRSGGTVDVASRLGNRLKEMGGWVTVEEGVRATFVKDERTSRNAPWRVEVQRTGTLL